MKIITEKAAYVQKKDLLYLSRSSFLVPASISIKISDCSVASNMYDFIRFSLPREIEFFKNLGWIIDYSEIKDLSMEECTELSKNLKEEKIELARGFNGALSEGNALEVLSSYKLLDFKINSLEDAINFKKGQLKFKLPKGVKYPDDLEQGGYVKRIIRKVFSKDKKATF